MKAQARQAASQQRLAQKRRDRLIERARNLNDADLLEIVVSRAAAQAKAKAKAAAKPKAKPKAKAKAKANGGA